MKLVPVLFRIGYVLGFALLVTGCVTTDVVKSVETNAAVRKVDFGKAPELRELAEHARRFGNEMYPKLCELFAAKGANPPSQFDVVFRPLEPWMLGETFVERRRITLNTMYLTNTPAEWPVFEKVLVHEMAHMALRHDYFRWSRPQDGWEEGLADYAYYKLIGTNGWGCPQCDFRYPHYTSGYTCAGAFLLYIESLYGPVVIQQLSAELRQRRYTDAFFATITGKSLTELWADFQKTSAYKPGAAEALALYQTLGFTGVNLPKNALRRFNKYLEQHADPFTKQAVKSANLDGKPMNVRALMAVYLYFTQPGGAAEKAWLDLRETGGVPGIIKGQKGSLSAYFRYDEIASQNFPQSRILVVRKQNDASVYHYTMVRASAETGWKLTKAWRTEADGKTVEEFPVP